MGKKGSWFSAIKRVFTPGSKDKPVHESEKKSAKEKTSRGKVKHGETKSFIPLFREPSSIEQILGEVDEQQLLVRHHPIEPSVRPTSPRFTLPSTHDSIITSSPKVSRHRNAYRPEPTLKHRHLSATKIQAAYRGYMARRSFRGLRGLVRLQGVVTSNNVRQQTVNAMKQMQLLVRVQTQIQSRRIQMLENQTLQHQAYKEGESTMTHRYHDDWDDSLLTKEEVEARLRKKVEAVMKRERAMAYAYSHQLWKGEPKSALNMGGTPWWWNWLERQLPTQPAVVKDIQLTPSEHKPSPVTFRRLLSDYDNHELSIPTRGTPPMNSSTLKKYSRMSRANSPYDVPLKDDDSLTSCPPFSAPRYMEPTVSAKAKARANSNPKERNSVNPSTSDSKRRFSFPLTPNIWSAKWNKGSANDSTYRKEVDKHESVPDHVSVDSTLSMPAVVGRKPFNRFV